MTALTFIFDSRGKRVNNPLHELGARAKRMLGIQRLHDRIDQLEAQLRVLEPGGWDRSRERWRNVEPDAGLTWGHKLTGNAFIAKVSEYGAFHPETRILEIGPGYGRLLDACLGRGAPFAKYLGVDISPSNVEHLRRRFTDQRVSFVVADAESVAFDTQYDLLLSSLVFKHLYPTFEPVLRNCAAGLDAGALTCFDLIEGSHSLFEADRVTYIKCYTRPEVHEILRRSGLDFVDFALVKHDETHERLLTVARKSPAADTL
jgi:SAM-dependent methyltransferase